MELVNRPYQDGQLDACESSYLKGVRKQVVSAATGTGKSHLIGNLPAKMKQHLSGQTLVLVHREELINQDIDKLHLVNPSLSISKEKAEEYADPNSDVIVASVASLGRKGTKRALRFNWEQIDKVITDECHHAPATTYMNIYEMANVLDFGNLKMHVGCTATPNGRADGKALSKIYQEIVHEYSLRQAIEDGWLVDVKGVRVRTGASLDDVKTVGGDFQADSLADAVNNPVRNQLAVRAWQEYAQGRQTVGFTVDIQHAVDAAAMFNHYGIPSEAIWGNDPDRAEKLERHRNKEFTCLFNCGVLVEGYDDWQIGCILHMCPTKSAIKYIQTTGRGTRLEPNVGNLQELLYACESTGSPILCKQDCIVIDLVDNSSKHSLVTLPTLMGMSKDLDLNGKSLVKAVRAIEEAQERYSHIDFTTLRSIDDLKTFIEETDLFNIKVPEEVETNSEFSWHRAASGGFMLGLPNKEKVVITENLLGKYEVRATINGKKYKGEREDLVSIFKCADNLVYNVASDSLKLVKREAVWHDAPATESQIKLLKRLVHGRPLPKDLTKGQAHKVIGAMLAQKG